MVPLQACPWCGQDPLYRRYHDEEWGVPLFDERRLFEFLILEGAQAGLAWITILRKREHYRQAFHDFRVERVAAMDAAEQERLLQNPGIVRNRLKVAAAVRNARAWQQLRAREGSVAEWLWSFVDHRPQQNHWTHLSQVPAVTPASEALSRALRQAGFGFVGPTIMYAFMQATGMVNDHLLDCPRHAQCAALAEQRPGLA